MSGTYLERWFLKLEVTCKSLLMKLQLVPNQLVVNG